MIPEHLHYTKEHEWVLVQGDEATIGITDYAQEQLGDVVYIKQPLVGQTLKQMQEVGEIESVKTVSSIYCPISGTVTMLNQTLNQNPAQINQDPYQKGWLFKLKITQPEDLKKLLDASAYQALLQK
jgi:glycine cleavage system H protein